MKLAKRAVIFESCAGEFSKGFKNLHKENVQFACLDANHKVLGNSEIISKFSDENEIEKFNFK